MKSAYPDLTVLKIGEPYFYYYRLLPQVARTYLCTRNLSDSPLGTWHRVPSIRKINQLSCQAGSKWRYMLRRGETLLMQFNPIMTMTA